MVTAKQLLEYFNKISGFDIKIVDRQFHTIMMQDNNARKARKGFCNSIQQSAACLEACLKSDKEAFGRLEKNQEMYVYICPFGITEALVPIFQNHTVVAYFFVVIGITKKENESLAVKRVLRTSREFDAEQIKELIKALPHNDENLCESYLQLLEVMAEYIGRHQLLVENRESLGELIKDYVDKNLDSKITLGMLSQKLHRSTVTLTECFRKEFGCSIMQYVLEQRMELALQLLKEDRFTVGEISAACGFQDVEYFSKCFKRHFGESPSIWRKKNATAPD